MSPRITIYFAYGANMDAVHMAEECPGAVRLGRAALPDHAIGVGAAGFATVRPTPGSSVHGVLWTLTPADEVALDGFERVADNFYRKLTVSVMMDDGTVEAMIYAAVDDRPGRPKRSYFRRNLEIAESEGFPPDYLAELRALATTP